MTPELLSTILTLVQVIREASAGLEELAAAQRDGRTITDGDLDKWKAETVVERARLVGAI